jgi:hypothetical protein
MGEQRVRHTLTPYTRTQTLTRNSPVHHPRRRKHYKLLSHHSLEKSTLLCSTVPLCVTCANGELLAYLSFGYDNLSGGRI